MTGISKRYRSEALNVGRRLKAWTGCLKDPGNVVHRSEPKTRRMTPHFKSYHNLINSAIRTSRREGGGQEVYRNCYSALQYLGLDGGICGSLFGFSTHTHTHTHMNIGVFFFWFHVLSSNTTKTDLIQ